MWQTFIASQEMTRTLDFARFLPRLLGPFAASSTYLAKRVLPKYGRGCRLQCSKSIEVHSDKCQCLAMWQGAPRLAWVVELLSRFTLPFFSWTCFHSLPYFVIVWIMFLLGVYVSIDLLFALKNKGEELFVKGQLPVFLS